MKNFPDHDQFDELEKRLRNYVEQPDEGVWKNIDVALRPNRPLRWLPWVDYFATATSIFVFALTFANIQVREAAIDSKMNVESAEAYQHTHENIIEEGHVQEKIERPHNRILPATPPQKPEVPSTVRKKPGISQRVPAKNKALGSMPSVLSQYPDDELALSSVPPTDTLLPAGKVPVDSVHNQKITKQAKRIPKRKPAVYASVTPSLSFQRAIPVASDQVIVQELSDVSIFSSERFGVSVDVGLQGFITRRLEYYSGLSLYHQHQTLKYSYQKGSESNVESFEDNSFTVTPKSSVGMVNYEMLNVGVQAGILYNLYGKNSSHKIGAGLSYQQGFIDSNSEGYENSESSYFSYQLFYRNEVRLSSRVRVFVQPVFTQSIHVREELNAPFNLKPYRAGIGFGILYDF